ncbi:MAG: hypothetical protein E7280_00355 [Lachnospiraceae bacterium]|nr:hypothetical protein [Lachnospiraceae bacterium]
MRYGAYPGKFAFIPEIKNCYRICTDEESRSRSQNVDFYEQMAAVDTEGFEEALKIAKSYNRVKPEDEDAIRRAFYVRLALSLLHGGSETMAEKHMNMAVEISKEGTLSDVEKLYCGEDYRERLVNMV